MQCALPPSVPRFLEIVTSLSWVLLVKRISSTASLDRLWTLASTECGRGGGGKNKDFLKDFWEKPVEITIVTRSKSIIKEGGGGGS